MEANVNLILNPVTLEQATR